MTELDPLLDKVAQFYNGTIAEYGPVAKGVNWKGERDQDIRFAYLADLIPASSEPIQIADLGCGYAAFYSFLKARAIPIAKYIGYDVSEAMIAAAATRIGDEANVTLAPGDKVDIEVDYSVASGIFNVSLGQEKEAWRSLVEATLDNLNVMSRRGFAFNMMTDKVDWKVDDLFYANAGEFLEYCTLRHSRKVRLYHDMPMFEWTMIVIKE